MARIARGISLEEWEEKTQLSETELQSVYDLQGYCAELPWPSSWSVADKISASSALGRTSSSGVRTPESSSASNNLLAPVNAGALSSRLTALSSRARSNSNLAAEADSATTTAAEKPSAHNMIRSDKPVETLQQFFDWYAVMEAEMEKDQEDVYRNHLSVVSKYRESCDNFLADLKKTSELFNELKQEYGFVEKRTRALQTACEDLLSEQERLTTLADALAERLAYFNELEPIAKLFNSPGDDICLRPEFVPMLQTLDRSIEYMQQHVRIRQLSYRDAELYLMRYRQCLTKGMTLIKMYAVTSIKSVGYEVYKQAMAKPSDQGIALSKQNTLFYVKFRMIAPTIKSLNAELEKRCEGHKEYQALYQDILNAYFQTRQNLLGPVISRKIQELSPNDGDLLTFARNGCACMMNLCLDEFNLFCSFFQSGEDEFYSYLDTLTSYLYDYLRPRIIHENDISTLSELCNIFQVYVFRDEQASEDIDDPERKRLAFGQLIQNVLEDAQTKLVFRAQTYIHNEIQNYHIKPEDFELRTPADLPKTSVVLEPNHNQKPSGSDASGPATLAIEEDNNSDTQSVKQSSESLAAADSPLGQGTDASRGWFPTLQKTLWILSKLYQCVQTAVFEDLAQEAVSLCNESLKKAAEIVTNTKSRLDGQLFLIKQLLVLKEQLAPFEANFVHSGKELDFSHVSDILSPLQQNRSLIFNPNALISLAQRGMPRVVEISIDSRREIDRELKRVCEDFITDCVRGAVEPLSNFIIKLSAIRPVHIETRDERNPATDEVRDAVEQFKESASERVRFVVKKLREYVKDYKIEQILMKPIQMNILEHYKSFSEVVERSLDPASLPMSVEAAAVWIAQLKE